MKDPNLKYFGMIFLTLCVGTAFTLSQYQLLPYFVVLYFFSFYALQSLKYGKDFFLTFDHKQELKDEKFIVAGQEVKSETHEDDQENRFLAVFDLATNVKRKGLSWGVLFGGGFTLFYVKNFDFTFATVLPLLACFFIVNAYYSGHLLVPLFVSLLGVVFHLSNPHGALYIPLYAFLFLNALSYFTKKNIVRKNLNYLIIASLFISVASAINFFLPKTAPLPDQQKTNLTPKQVKAISEIVSKNQAQTQKLLSKMGDLPSKIGQSAEAKKLFNELQTNEQLLQRVKELEAKNNLSPSEKAELSTNLDQLSNNLSQSQDSYDDLINKSANGYFKDLEDEKVSNELAKNTGQLSDLEINTLRSQLQKTAAQDLPENIKVQREKIDELLTRPQTEKTRAEVIESLQKIGQEQKAIKEKILTENKIEKIKVEKVEDLKEKPVQEKKSWMSKLKRLLPPIIFIIILFILHYFFSKKGIKKVEPLNQEVLEELQNEWLKARKLKFSPREEVIYFYNLFHKSMQKIHYQDHETPPSCIVYENMKTQNPDIENSTLVVTEVYAQCFYGDQDVTSEALKLFRKSLNKIVRIYQLK